MTNEEKLISTWEQAGLIPTFDPRVRAYHEAGHVLVALLVGTTVEHVDIQKRIITVGSRSKIIFGTCKVLAAPSASSEDNIRIDLAGRAAECLLGGDGSGGTGDVSHVTAHLCELGYSPEDASEYVDIILKELTDFLTAPDNWAAVVEIAERLIAETILSGSAVHEIIVKHRGDRIISTSP